MTVGICFKAPGLQKFSLRMSDEMYKFLLSNYYYNRYAFASPDSQEKLYYYKRVAAKNLILLSKIDDFYVPHERPTVVTKCLSTSKIEDFSFNVKIYPERETTKEEFANFKEDFNHIIKLAQDFLDQH